jgi:hypothetical protein
LTNLPVFCFGIISPEILSVYNRVMAIFATARPAYDQKYKAGIAFHDIPFPFFSVLFLKAESLLKRKYSCDLEKIKRENSDCQK